MNRIWIGFNNRQDDEGKIKRRTRAKEYKLLLEIYSYPELQLRGLLHGLAPGTAPISHVNLTYSRPKILMFVIDRFAR